jgi:hypothetical protein
MRYELQGYVASAGPRSLAGDGAASDGGGAAAATAEHLRRHHRPQAIMHSRQVTDAPATPGLVVVTESGAQRTAARPARRDSTEALAPVGFTRSY